MRLGGIIGPCVWILAALAGPAAGDPEPPPPLTGFTEAAAAEQRSLEARFDALIDAKEIGAWMERLAARPHHVGSPYGKTNAHWMAQQLESWGFDAKLEVFWVLFPTPTVRVVEMTAPRAFSARLVEPALPEDKTSNQRREQLASYNAYSIDGDVTGELVYVNYGVPEDYEVLERHGIDVAGKIVIARYGRSWRGIKPKVAAEHGAIGCLLYSDPRDDGFFHGDPYPAGAFKNEHGVQRGSVADMPLFPGDPLTPGVGATKNAERLERSEAPTLTKIPVLPISWADAKPMLAALEGPVAPVDWRGALPQTYHIGPGPTEVHLQVAFDWEIVPAYDVIATLRGSELSDEWIVRGNHHDAWVNGANDPISGLVAMLAEAKALGTLAKDGWQPKRTIVYAAWDAEEPGLLGSTEWVETHADVLADKAAVYINTDSNGRGFLNAGGSHTLERFFNEVARDVTDPQKGISIRERARARTLVHGDADTRREAAERDDLRLYALGSGSDYTPFLQHLGIASLNVGFGGENAGGEYHSVYDSIDHYKRFKDPGFAYGATLARTTGRAVLRLAEAEVLPFTFGNFAETVGGYAREVRDLADSMRRDTEFHNRLVAEGRFDAAADPLLDLRAPDAEVPVPHLNFAPLDNAIVRLSRSAEHYDSALALSGADVATLSADDRTRLDRLLYTTERALTRAEGLPDRQWFRHFVYAPGFYTGYGVKTLPGVRESIEGRRWDAVDREVTRVAEVLHRFSDRIDEATAILSRATAASGSPGTQP